MTILARLSEADEGALADVVGELEALRASIHGARDPGRLAEVAAAIPARVGHLRAETSLALQKIALELARYRPQVPGDLADLDLQLRVPWLRAWISADAAAAVRGLDEQTLLAVVHEWSLQHVVDPRPLLEAMVGAADVRLRLGVLPRLEGVVSSLVLGPRQAYRVIAPLLGDSDPEVRAAALRLAASGWMADLAPADARRRSAHVMSALEDPELRVAQAGVVAAASLGEDDGLRAAIDDDARPAAIRPRRWLPSASGRRRRISIACSVCPMWGLGRASERSCCGRIGMACSCGSGTSRRYSPGSIDTPTGPRKSSSGSPTSCAER